MTVVSDSSKISQAGTNPPGKRNRNPYPASAGSAGNLYLLGPVNTYVTPCVATRKTRRQGAKQRGIRIFRAQPEGTGGISSSPSLLAAYEGSLCRAPYASCWTKSITVASVR